MHPPKTGFDRQRPIVVKIGGTTLEEQGSQPALWESLVSLCARHPAGIVLVHGGGKAVDRHLARLGIHSERREGIRITPEDQMGEIVSILAGVTNKGLVASIIRAGGKPVGLCLGDGRSLATAKATRYSFDPGRVGEVIPPPPAADGWDGTLLKLLLAHGFTPVIASIGIDEQGGFLNVNADDAAAGVAVALSAGALILLTDVPGLLDARGTVVPKADSAAIEAMIASGEIKGGMIPKTRAALETSRACGAPVVILNGNDPSALASLLQGAPVGTHIVY
jgi:acetylglutamate kinase